MKKYIPFLTFWLVDILLLWLANWFYPTDFVLGNAAFSFSAALIWAGFVWTLLVWIAMPIAKKLNIKIEGSPPMILFYWLANFLALWLTARFAPITGFGISSFIWALALGLMANFIQYGIWKLGKFEMYPKAGSQEN